MKHSQTMHLKRVSNSFVPLSWNIQAQFITVLHKCVSKMTALGAKIVTVVNPSNKNLVGSASNKGQGTVYR